ncbi:aminotransferase-like domain-containing protein [Granulicella mallensis]|uniref:Putative transcriptional regulator, GntR family n=1 Tax=Granulicella mallensis (strain ATCC BAA-1857 / DSM 23137 / MP5ACTX8) TaxID=682795 RepID=G8P000_GRAMM|nr:PLP-dependent aminotransferase family protein [Granulicella mallensis]AEU35716.1 putative transcriptional regulator, GntR family [Granulicella mallensis MP5ACTX8]
MIEMQYNFPLLPGQPEQWRERLRAAVDALDENNFNELRPTFRSNQTALTNAGARWMGTPPERTFLTEGGHHGSLISLMVSGLAGQTIAVDAAAYTGALVQARAMRCPLIGCAVDDEGMVAESLREHCAAEGNRVAAIYVTPTVHNPLGCVASLARREALVAVAREFDLLIVEDDAYGYMEPDAPPTLAKLAPERTFYVRGLSKSYAPGARTGFLVVPERFIPGLSSAIMNSATGSSLVHNRAAVSLVEDGTLDRVIAEKNVEGARRNAAARSLLRNRCWAGARAAWHLWVNLPSHTTPQWFEQRMIEREVAISGGNWFATSKDAPNGFRIALGGEVDAERALEGVARVAEELDRLS